MSNQMKYRFKRNQYFPSEAAVKKPLPWGKLITGLLIGLCFLETYVLVFHSSFFSLEEIVVRGNRSLSAGEVVELSQIDTGARMFQLSFSSIKMQLESDPRIKSAELVQLAPRRLQIQVVEEEVKIYFWSNSSLLGMNEEGKFFPVQKPAKVPRIHMDLTEKEWEVYQLNPERHDSLLRWIKVLSGSKLYKFQEFRMESGNRLTLVYQGVRVYLQSTLEFQRHEERALAVFSHVQKSGKRLDYIDLRFEDMVVKIV